MRLTPEEIAGIKDAVAETFGPEASVRLFGSRVNDALKGGDIDLLVEVPAGMGTLRKEIACEIAIIDRIGEQKIDVLLVEPGRRPGAIHEIALRDGVVL